MGRQRERRLPAPGFRLQLKGLTDDSGSDAARSRTCSTTSAPGSRSRPRAQSERGNVAAARTPRRRPPSVDDEFSESDRAPGEWRRPWRYEAARRTVESLRARRPGVARANVDVVRQSYGLGRDDVSRRHCRAASVHRGRELIYRRPPSGLGRRVVDVERAIGGPIPMTRCGPHAAASPSGGGGCGGVEEFVWGERRAARAGSRDQSTAPSRSGTQRCRAPASSTEEPVEVSLTSRPLHGRGSNGHRADQAMSGLDHRARHGDVECVPRDDERTR